MLRSNRYPTTPRARSLRVETIVDREALDEIGPAWDALAAAAKHASPLTTHLWFTTQLDENRKLRRGGEVHWRCFAAFDGDELVGVMPLIEEPRDLRSLRGPLVRVPGEYYLRSGEPLLAQSRSREVLDALIEAVRTWKRGIPLEFGSLRADDDGTLSDLRARPGTTTRPEARGRMIRIEGTAQAWFDSLGRSHRKNVARRGRRLDEAFPGQVQYRVVNGEDAAPMLEQFARLEATGWKGQESFALLASPSKMRFYRRLCVRLAKRGWLEWHVLEVAGEPVVIDMWIRMGRTLAGLFTAYDERFARFSPGALRLRRTIDEAFESGEVDIVDVLTAHPWTEHWGMETYLYHRALVTTGNPVPLWIDDAAFAARRTLRSLGVSSAMRALNQGLQPRPAAADDGEALRRPSA